MYSLKSILWQDITDSSKPMTPSDTFQRDHHYRVYVYLLPKDGFCFESDMNGYIGQHSATFYLMADGRGRFHCDYGAPLIPLESVAINITSPAVGKAPSYTFTVPSGSHYGKSDELGFEESIRWYDVDSDTYISWFSDYTFEAGHTYSVDIIVDPEEGYCFKKGVKGTINGISAAHIGGSFSCTFPPLPAGGWKKDSKGWWYQRADGTYPKNQWEKINGKWYHFDASGYMQTGWLKLDGKWYYFNPGDDGSMVTGWKKLDGKWYYFNTGNDGSMVTGWQTLGGKRYYFSSDGSMMTGWQKLSGKWYYFKPGDDGAMVTGWQTLGGKRYYFNSDGSMVTGWQKLSGKWYYFAPGDSGYMLTGWQKLNNKWYYFNTDGSMATGWQRINSKWYYFLPGDNGQMVTGWKQIDGDWYYFMPGNDGSMVTGTMTIDGVSYTFASNGVCTNP